ncbi:spermidine/putrescine ABC transporter substrate-binding protein [bacterium]|nr:spermidine/putrescine ABC transporter substrate-binding protein [bacterium]
MFRLNRIHGLKKKEVVGRHGKGGLFKCIFSVCISFVAAVSIAGHAYAGGELHVYNWGDYINPEVLKQFSEEFDVKVTLSTYNSNEEMLAKVQAGAVGYDIVFPSVHMHDIMYKLNLLYKTNINKSPDFKNIDPDFLRAKTDPKGEWCLPYAWGTVGIMYNRKLIGGDINSWKELFDLAKAKNLKIAMLDDMRETIGVGLILNGKSVNTRSMDDLRLAQKTMIDLRPYISAFTYDSPPMVASGDLAAAHFFTGSLIVIASQEPANRKHLNYIIPDEGATMYQEDICVLKSSPNKENALKFLEFYLRPEIPVLNIKQQWNGTPNAASQKILPDVIKNNKAANPPPETMKKLQIFEDIGKDLKKYNRVWTKIKTAQ